MAKKKQQTKRIGDAPESVEACQSPHHFADPEVERDPGEYEHVCPDCGVRVKFVVPEEEPAPEEEPT